MISMEGSDFATKQETSRTIPGNPKPSRASSSWSRLKDPRIVCVSRAFGGKDRHSKVCTVRGIRDRRVRLSVSTAIQLYDLQDRLGLNQPSKVVDWLLNAAKDGINGLPPLHIPDGCFSSMINSHDLQAKENPRIGTDFPWNDQKNPRSSPGVDTGKIGNKKEEIKEFDHVNACFQVPGQGNISGSMENACVQVPGLMGNPGSRENGCFQVPSLYNSFFRFNPSNLSLSPIPGSIELADQPDPDMHNFGLWQLPPTAPVPPDSISNNQVLVCQPGMATQPHFPSQDTGTNTGFVPKESNFLSSVLLNSSCLPSPVHHFGGQTAIIRTLPFGATINLLGSEKNNALQQDRNDEFYA